jgi:sulfur carrier protein ThiS
MITAKGKQMEWYEGLTVEAVLQSLGYAVPSAMALLDGRHVPRNEWSATEVPDGSTLDVRAMAAGG